MAKAELIEQVLRATWSLEEAAHLVHAVNQATHPVEITELSSDAVARTYFWLKKEHGKGRLFANAGDEKAPRFSPGTLMRHLEESGKSVSKEVLKIYDSAYGHHGIVGSNPNSKQFYMDAAELIWKQFPDLPATKVAHQLVNLPKKYPNKNLINYGADTIRKFLNGKGPGKVGRPSSEQGISDQAALDELEG